MKPNFSVIHKKKWKIIYYKGRIVMKGFNSSFNAKQMIPKLKLNPQEDLRVVEE